MLSPPWSATTKLVAGLSFAALIGGMIIYFRGIVGWLLLAFVLTYLLHPVVHGLSKVTRLSWRASVNVVYLLVLLLLIGSFTATGVAIVQQFQALIETINRRLSELPAFLDNISQVYTIANLYTIDLRQLDLSSIGQQLISSLQTVLSQAGSILSAVATSAVSLMGWLLFVLLVSYFVLSDSGQVPDMVRYLHIPGYDYDVRRMGREFNRIWNAFLRGQILIIALVILASGLLLSILGMRFAFNVALLVGLARFVPYIGTFTTDIIIFLVAIFQSGNYLGMSQTSYAFLVLGMAILLDQVFDNIISPRILGQSLGVHPAAVLIGAILAARLLGFVGLVLAAPVLASLRLLARYAFRKMLDMDPWPEPESQVPTLEIPGKDAALKLLRRVGQRWRKR
ncbi:MAG: AI-2E family transporter [Anaerolineales bacterium]